MRLRDLRSIAAIALVAALAVGCQAPGFMGLSGNSTAPDSADGNRIVRARFQVLVPTSLATGIALVPATSTLPASGQLRYDERAVIGAKVYLDGQPNVSDLTDDQGYASLGIPQGRLTPVRAEFKTADGTVTMSALAYVGRDAGAAAIVPITIASTLVSSKIAQHFKFGDLRYLDPDHLRADTDAFDQALRLPDGTYDPQLLPRLGRTWSVLDVAQAVDHLDPLLNKVLADVLATRIPAPDEASGSLTASGSTVSVSTDSVTVVSTGSATASLTATATLTASPSLAASSSILVGTETLFPAEVGQRWVYDLFDDSGKRRGRLVRQVARLTPRPGGFLAAGRETGDWNPDGNEMRFLLRRSTTQVEFAAAFRPSVAYPLPLTDGLTWKAAPGVGAIAHAPDPTQDGPRAGAWRVDFTQVRDGDTATWSEWLVPGVGFTAFQWVDSGSGRRWEARLAPTPTPTPSPKN